MHHALIRQLGSDVEAAIEAAAEAADAPAHAETVEMRWGGEASLIWDPTLTTTGFLLHLTAVTEEGPLEAAFNARGELRRGRVGDRIVEDGEALIKRWRRTIGPPPAVALGLSES